jgi:hypothetical protein
VHGNWIVQSRDNIIGFEALNQQITSCVADHIEVIDGVVAA